MKKILVVEDEEKMAGVLEMALREEGYEVILAADGPSGLDQVRSQSPDLILLDVLLPGMGGFEVCRALKSDPEYQSIPVLLLTGLADSENRVKGLSSGADDYVSKPFHFPELIARIRSNLRMKELYDTVKKEDAEKTALLDISKALSSTVTPHDTLYAIVSKIAEVVEVKRCSIIYVDPRKNKGTVMASHDSQDIRHLDIDLDKYPEILKVMETKKPVIIHDVYTDPILFSVRDVLNLINLKSIMAFPVTFKDALIGTLVLRTARREVPFNEREIRFCSVISHLAAAPLKNAYLFEVLHEEREREREGRLTAEEKLHHLSCAVEQCPIVVLITDIRGNIEYVNPMFTETTGYAPEEVLGKNPRILKSGETPPDEYARLWKTIASGGTWRGEFHNRKKNGDLWWELASISPIRNREGKITHYLAVKEDITRQKEILADQLFRMEKMGALGLMAAGIAHELNNPLMGVINFIQYALRQTAPEDKRHSVLQDAERATRRCVAIVEDLLSFSRTEKDKDAEGSQANCAEILEGVLKLLNFRIEGEGIFINKQYGEGIPEIWVEKNKIQQLFLNLIHNALDAVAGCEKKEIQIHLEQEGRFVRLTISDSGAGISPENLPMIFNPFFTTKPVGKGTGLGLSVSQNIVNIHGGKIFCESKRGEGTKFKVLLPIDRKEKSL